MATLLDGKKIAQGIKEGIKKDLALLKQEGLPSPVLASVVVAENPASSVYVKAQAQVAAELGIEYRLLSLASGISQRSLIAEIAQLNKDRAVSGILIHAPLPEGLNIEEAVASILPEKDAEGMHPQNLGKLVLGKSPVAPCTAGACMELLVKSGVKLYGKEAVVVGHSNIVGKPLSLMLLREFATTTVCHVATSEANALERHVRGAEILIVAVGKPGLIKGDWIRQNAAVVDVGINRVGDKIVGDVEFETASLRAAYITPVPGGVGPLTVTMLMKNCVELFKESLNDF